jgi:protein phosphatase
MLQARSDVGLEREANEDVALAEDLPGGGSLLAVADGVGGYAGGEVASRAAVNALAAVLRNAPGDSPEAALRRAFAAATREVRARQLGGRARMSTTLVAAVVRDGIAWVGNVGDSRAYLVADGRARQLTLDHSWVAESIRAGRLTEDDPAALLNRNLITRSIGSETDVEVDVFGPLELPSGALLLLCSDGLHGVLDDERIAEVLAASTGDYAGDLVDAVIESGAPDNVAVALLAQPRNGSG